jgi:nuclear pore complex protein Nup205
MADPSTLDALQAFHQEILSLHEGRTEGVEVFDNEYLVHTFEQELGRVWKLPPRSDESRRIVLTGWSEFGQCANEADKTQASFPSMEKNFPSMKSFKSLP